MNKYILLFNANVKINKISKISKISSPNHFNLSSSINKNVLFNTKFFEKIFIKSSNVILPSANFAKIANHFLINTYSNIIGIIKPKLQRTGELYVYP